MSSITETVLTEDTVEVRIIHSMADFYPAELEELSIAEVVAYDVETTGLDPLDPEREMLGIGIAIKPERGYYLLSEAWHILQTIPLSAKWVAHNGKFDNRWLARYGIHVNQTFDTMLAAYILDENRSTYKLERLAVEILEADPYHEDTEAALSGGRGAEIPHEQLAERCVRDCIYTLHLYRLQRKEIIKDAGLCRVFQHLMMPVSRLLEGVENTGLPLDLDLLTKRYRLLHEALKAHQAAAYDSIGDDSLNLKSTKVLRQILYTQLSLPVVKMTKGGKPSTDKEVLVHLQDKSPFVNHLMNHRKCVKFDGYYNRWRERAVAGWLRGSFFIGRQDQADKTRGTRTGRLSSDLQQIPRQQHDTPLYLRMKDLVVAPPGFMLLEADSSQMEMRVMAWISGDLTLRGIYNRGEDVYIEAAKNILKIANPTKEDRQRAKPVVLGFQYGMGAKKFVIEALTKYGIRFTLAEAQAFRLRFFQKFDGLSRYYMRQEAEVRRTHQVRTPFGRIRHLPDIMYPAKAQEAVRQAINTPIQATASDLNTLAAIEAYPQMPTGTKFLLPYHDATLWLVPEAEVLPAARLLKHVMEETVPKVIVPQKFGVTCPVPLVADITVGRSWGGMKEIA